MKKVVGFGCLGFAGLMACYLLTLVILPAYAVAETARQLPMFASEIEAWAMGSDLGQEAVVEGSLGFAMEGYSGPESFTCLLPPTFGALSSPFGDTEGRKAPHRGIDYSTCWCENYPVRTPYGGRVTYAGDHAVYGGAVVIENQGWQVLFAHLSAALVAPGQIVVAGDVIGSSGNTGRFTTGPHVHFEVRECDVGTGACTARDPTRTFLPGQGAFCDWEHLGAGVSCTQYRADPVNVCPGMP